MSINNIAYQYDENFIFVKEVLRQFDPREKKYLLPGNATLVKPIDYDPQFEYLQLNTDKTAWIKKDIKLNGEYYLKSNGEHFTEIFKKDISLYTKVQPTLTIYTTKNENNEIIDESKIAFINEEWIYTDKALKQIIEEKIILLQENYNNSQYTLIKGKVSFYIKLQGQNYKDIKDRRNEAKENFYSRVIIQDNIGKTYSTSLPYIILSEVIWAVNYDYSELNKVTLERYRILLQNATKENIESINLDVFQSVNEVNLNNLIEELSNLTNEQLKDVDYGYNDVEIFYFNEWISNLTKDSEENYLIFLEMNISV